MFIVNTMKIESETNRWGGIMDSMRAILEDDLVKLMFSFDASKEQVKEALEVIKFDPPKTFQTTWGVWTVFIQVRKM